MFVKIFKHAFLRSLKTGIILGVISLISAVLAGVLTNLYNNLQLQGEIVPPIMISASAILQLVANVSGYLAFILAIGEFRKAVATDEAYLTYTLPATPKTQFWARFLALFAWLMISVFLSNITNFIYYSIVDPKNAQFWITIFFQTPKDFGGFMLNAQILLLIIVVCFSIVSTFVFSILAVQALSARFNDKIAVFIMAGIYFLEVFVFVCVFLILFSSAWGRGDFNAYWWIWSFIIYSGATAAINIFFCRKIMGRWLNLV